MKKLLALIAPCTLLLSACATDGTATSNPSGSAQQLGVAAVKIAVNAKCTTELNNIQAWKTATKLMTEEQKQDIQTEICGCVSDKAPQSVTAVDLATAALDPAARATLATNVVTKTINACVAEAVNK